MSLIVIKEPPGGIQETGPSSLGPCRALRPHSRNTAGAGKPGNRARALSSGCEDRFFSAHRNRRRKPRAFRPGRNAPGPPGRSP